MSEEEFFLANRAEIERAVRFVASRSRLSPEDAENLLSSVHFRLIENDYAVVRKFKGDCAFATYVVVIARHVLADERMHELGRFRPSAEAKRIGPPAVLLETLLYRDHQTLNEALAVVQTHYSLSKLEAEAMAARLRRRESRPRAVPIEEGFDPAVDAQSVEELVVHRERLERSAKINSIVQNVLTAVPLKDRLAFRLRLQVPPVSVADIARTLGLDQKKLYRRFEAIENQLREALRKNGVTREEILDLTDGTGSQFDFDPGGPENRGPWPPIDPRGSGNEVPQ